jgi:hypothetical protein
MAAQEALTASRNRAQNTEAFEQVLKKLPPLLAQQQPAHPMAISPMITALSPLQR